MPTLNFRQTVESLAEESQIRSSTWDGMIESITTHFPPGSNALVEVKVYHGSTQIIPEKGGLALDDASPSFPIKRKVSKGDDIRVEWVNHDNTYPHTITVVVSIRRKEIEVPVLER